MASYYADAAWSACCGDDGDDDSDDDVPRS